MAHCVLYSNVLIFRIAEKLLQAVKLIVIFFLDCAICQKQKQR